MTPTERQHRARDLQGDGLTLRQIADELGVSLGTVHRDLNPKAAKRYRAASAEQRRQKRQKKSTKRR